MSPDLDKCTFKRAQTYGLLSECYYEPSDDFVHTVGALMDEIGVEFRQLRSCLGPTSDSQSLKRDYVRLFVGPFKALAPPYGSVYLEPDARLMGASTVDAEAWYRKDGLRNTLQEPADHIVTELEFLSFLTGKALCADGIDEDRGQDYWIERERRFLGTHVVRWVPSFCRDVVASAETPFYRALAEETRLFVESVSGNHSPSVRGTALPRGGDHGTVTGVGSTGTVGARTGIVPGFAGHVGM